MDDLVFLGIILVFFGLSVWLVHFLDSLPRSE